MSSLRSRSLQDPCARGNLSAYRRTGCKLVQQGRGSHALDVEGIKTDLSTHRTSQCRALPARTIPMKTSSASMLPLEFDHWRATPNRPPTFSPRSTRKRAADLRRHYRLEVTQRRKRARAVGKPIQVQLSLPLLRKSWRLASIAMIRFQDWTAMDQAWSTSLEDSRPIPGYRVAH